MLQNPNANTIRNRQFLFKSISLLTCAAGNAIQVPTIALFNQQQLREHPTAMALKYKLGISNLSCLIGACSTPGYVQRPQLFQQQQQQLT
jgi:hypothetical protein